LSSRCTREATIASSPEVPEPVNEATSPVVWKAYWSSSRTSRFTALNASPRWFIAGAVIAWTQVPDKPF
jgi:hypothetical protein